jgi:hypothetical protein
MSSFERDRDLIVALPTQYAKSILELLDNGATHAETPSELREAFAAAQRCPDVSRFFLIEKMRGQVDEKSHRSKGIE